MHKYRATIVTVASVTLLEAVSWVGGDAPAIALGVALLLACGWALTADLSRDLVKRGLDEADPS